MPDLPLLTNLARQPGAQAFQSSTAYYGDAFRAIDGSIDGNYWNWSVTHTDITPVQAIAPDSGHFEQWWTIDLGAIRTVRHVTIWNRTDCCAERLGSFTIWAVNPGSGAWYPIGGANMNGNRVIDVDTTNMGTQTVSTQTIWIQKNDNDFLSLAEVEVWGPM